MVRFGRTRLVVGLALLLLLGCGDKKNPLGEYQAPGQLDSGQTDSGAVVSYSQTIAPMMAASCTMSGCHGDGTSIPLDTYEGVKANAAISNQEIQDGFMPIGAAAKPLTATDKQNFQDWVTAGTPNN